VSKWKFRHTLLHNAFFWQKNIRTYCHAEWEMVSHRRHGKHRKVSTYLHVSTRKKSHAKAQRARSVMSFCSYVKNRCTQISQKYTEFCSACFCEGLRRLRETITLRTAFVKIRAIRGSKNTSRYASQFCVFRVKLLHADVAEQRRRFAKLCAFAWEERYVLLSSVKHKILCHSVHCFPLTSSDSDFQFCVQSFRYSVLALAKYEKIKKSEISNSLGGHLDFAEICCIFV